jgi:hypothetical protein
MAFVFEYLDQTHADQVIVPGMKEVGRMTAGALSVGIG